MKISFKTISQLTAAAAIAAVMVSCGNKEQAKSGAPAAASTSGSASSEQKIVFVNSDSLVANYDYFKDIRNKLEVKSKKAQQDLTSKGNAFQREVSEYQQKAKDMSADERASTEQRLARKQQELAAFNQNASSALANESASENEKLYDKVAEYLKTYAKDKGYKMVLTYSKSNPSLLFADESLDVTKDVLKGLNEAYGKEKK
ncbi:OmpH family outer membrane protein [Arcticibacter sp. MXS-1]|uniref:OmpH family outer membrane protein n=1 Tax=Arcticibacter sp. MXS-1 TaxID=3341726 RepID=UPI0035A879BB